MFIFKKTKLKDFQNRNNTRTYDIMDVATFIVNYCAETKRSINNLYLQKLLYFVHAFFLVETKEQRPLFNSIMEAWAFGPAFPEVYYSYNMYETGKIPYQETYSHFKSTEKISYNKNIIDSRDRAIIMYIVDKYRDKSLSEIVFITQSQEPWSVAYGLAGNRRCKTIDNKAIADYFCIHRQA